MGCTLGPVSLLPRGFSTSSVPRFSAGIITDPLGVDGVNAVVSSKSCQRARYAPGPYAVDFAGAGVVVAIGFDGEGARLGARLAARLGGRDPVGDRILAVAGLLDGVE